jgi:hypothetical protein
MSSDVVTKEFFQNSLVQLLKAGAVFVSIALA